MSTLRTEPLDHEGTTASAQAGLPLRWALIAAAAGAAGIGAGATAGWPAGIVVTCTVAAALHAFLGN